MYFKELPKNILLFFFLITFVLSCASLEPIDTGTPEGLYKMGKELMEQERFEEALANFNELKNKYPYNNLATDAELQIADIHFARENYVEAENAYKIFKEFHPKHSRIDYVTFQIAMSLYKQLPDSIDRDLNLADDAKIYFRQVYRAYPNSDYAGSAQDHEKKCQIKLARSIFYVAQFYYNTEHYESALGRYEDVIKKYPDTGLVPKSLYGAAMSAFKLNKKDQAKIYFGRLVSNYPDNQWTTRAKRALKW